MYSNYFGAVTRAFAIGRIDFYSVSRKNAFALICTILKEKFVGYDPSQ